MNLDDLDDYHFLGTTSSEGASDACTESPSACCMTSCWMWIRISVGISLADLATAIHQSPTRTV